MPDNFTVIATARRIDRLKQLDLPENRFFQGDLTDYDFQDRLLETIYRQFNRCDYLFNCAGSIEVAEIEKIDIDKLTAMLRLNIEATFRLTYKVLKKMKISGLGHIINISSVLGTKARPTAGAYAATKFALEALSEALRMELANSQIKISCIEPGLVNTELHDNWPVHPRESMNIEHPLEAEDVVNAIRFVMSQPVHVKIPKLMLLPTGHQI
jgi:NADP-dependent 3-hydroxy acid dehydrogenase YdfG